MVFCTACASGSSSYDSNTGWPSDTLTMRMLRRLALSRTQARALMTSLVWPEPSALRTLSETMRAPGATPP